VIIKSTLHFISYTIYLGEKKKNQISKEGCKKKEVFNKVRTVRVIYNQVYFGFR